MPRHSGFQEPLQQESGVRTKHPESLFSLRWESVLTRFFVASIALFVLALLVVMGGIGLDHSPMRSLPLPFAAVVGAFGVLTMALLILFHKRRWI